MILAFPCSGFYIKNTPKFLTQNASLTKLPSNSSWQPVNSCDRCLGANMMSSVLSWFNFNRLSFIHLLISDKQDSNFCAMSFQMSRCLITRDTWYHQRNSDSSCHVYYKFHRFGKHTVIPRSKNRPLWYSVVRLSAVRLSGPDSDALCSVTKVRHYP
jgi:hypothetical protein